MKAFLKASLVGVLLAALTAVASEEKVAVKDTLEERVKPVGELCMAGEECASAVTAGADVAAGPRSGQDVYGSKCVTCHGTGAAGAPKFGDVAGWAPRIAKGMDVLYTHAISGFNGMPAKGLCFDCSDDEIKAAVDHLVENSK